MHEESNLVDEGTALYEDKDTDDVWEDRIRSAVQTLLHEAVAHYGLHTIPYLSNTRTAWSAVFLESERTGEKIAHSL